MQLSKYLKEKNILQADFARKLGCAPQTVERYANGKRIPGIKRMRQIFAVTDGVVTANDFYGIANYSCSSV